MMSKFWRALFFKWKNASYGKRQVMILVAMSAAGLSLWVALLSVNNYLRSRSPAMFVALVKEGDDAFRGYKYADALRSYQQAERRLDAIIKFEDESPSKNASVLQHYYNSKVFIKARIQLVLIADDISRSEYYELPKGQEVPGGQRR